MGKGSRRLAARGGKVRRRRHLRSRRGGGRGGCGRARAHGSWRGGRSALPPNRPLAAAAAEGGGVGGGRERETAITDCGEGGRAPAAPSSRRWGGDGGAFFRHGLAGSS